ncbi:hypothetical protein QMK17_21600 [Rhodococcus sp. G-MC3]|uniref:hypothetical protein n=1 Tax=Rhodococcus sp. G-MC3 TaxID=3046209 RepID=UPI0024BB9E7F|nr:hypothetical protein [Rhodococcus sp. G-MC3]MDJ0395918.1 hypothetical protein [Rhodococcus sp. G-MC3]
MSGITASASTRDHSIHVRASEGGLPVSVHIDQDELRFGGAALAATLVDLIAQATRRARAQRRTLLEREGMEASILDRLGLPTASSVAASENDRMGDETAPTSWLRSV